MFRDRNVRNVVLARLISSAGVEASFFIGLWGKAAFEFDGTPTDLALMSALIGLGVLVGSLVGGVLVDRFDPRRVIIAAEIAFVPATLLMIFATSIPRLLLLGVVSWTAGGILETGIVSMPPSLVDDDRLDAANARLESANWLAMIAGPAVGAVLARVFTIDAVFVFDAITSVVALVLVARVTLRAKPADVAPAGTGLRDVREGLRYAFRTPKVVLILYVGSLLWLGFGVFVALEPLYFRDVVGTGPEAIGYVNALFGAGLFAGSVLMERSRGRFTAYRTTIVVTVMAALGSLVYVGTSNLGWVLVGAVVWSIPLGVALPMGRTLAQRATAPGYVGRVMGAFGVVQAAASVVPVVFAPAAAAAIGVQAVLFLSGVSIIVLAPLAWRYARRMDGEHGPADPAPEPA